MYNKNFDQLITRLTEKKKKHSIKVTVYVEDMRTTTRIKGSIKNAFLDDCIKRELNESKVAAHIFEAYYSAVSQVPGLIDKEPSAIKQYIIDKIKFE